MEVEINRHGGVVEVTLNRPESMNAIDPAMREQLHVAFREVATDASARVLILTGAGDRAFCTGADLKRTMPPKASAAELEFTPPSDHLLANFPWDLPSICAIKGYAIGGGLELALACDIRIASSTAQLGLSEVKVGSIPGAGGTQLLPRVVGRSAALKLVLTGERVDAETALRLGLVDEVLPVEDVVGRARQLAGTVAANAPLAVRAVKRLVSAALDMPLQEGLRMERYVWGLLRDTEDRLEGRRAFAEKRSPNYEGR